MPRSYVRDWPVMEDDDKGVKFVPSSSTLTFASITYNNGHILLVVVVVGRCQGGRCPHPSSCTWKIHCKGRGSILLVIYFLKRIRTRGSTCDRRSADRCALMICVSFFILLIMYVVYVQTPSFENIQMSDVSPRHTHTPSSSLSPSNEPKIDAFLHIWTYH